MSPDYLLRCTVCGREATWDTEALPPVGTPDVGHPVLWWCESCGREQRHTIQAPFVIADKLHHEICLATETDRQTVDNVMGGLCQYRLQISSARRPADAIKKVAAVVGVPPEVVAAIATAEAAWMTRRGYPAPTSDEP